MSYWKGLMLAAAIDLVWIMGCPLLVTEPELSAPSSQARYFALEPVPVQDSLTVAALTEISRLEDSLMTYIQAHPDDVDAIQQLAGIYASNDWHDRAIGPLARALQLDPSRRSLWVALDRAVEKSGRAKITDAELIQRANAFVETVDMWGHGC